MAGYPQYPVLPEWHIHTPASYSYYSTNMNWFVFAGSDDEEFDAWIAQEAYHDIFADLNIMSAIKYEVIADNVGHEIDSRYIDVMMKFINDGEVGSIDDFIQREHDWYWYEDYYYEDWGDYEDDSLDGPDFLDSDEEGGNRTAGVIVLIVILIAVAALTLFTFSGSTPALVE